jgi:uncharacterized protein (DUF427 family)
VAAKPIRIPGPDHPITIDPHPGRVRILLGDLVVADTDGALTLREASYPAVSYIPRADADMTLLTPSSRTTYCPFKGECSYFHLPSTDGSGANAVWTYEIPHDAMKQIAGYLAFYPDRVTINSA